MTLRYSVLRGQASDEVECARGSGRQKTVRGTKLAYCEHARIASRVEVCVFN